MTIGIMLIVLGLLGLLLATAIRKVPGVPPHFGAIKRFGRLTGETRGPGLTLLMPIIEDMVYVSQERRDLKLAGIIYRTRDFAQVDIPILCGWSPDPKRPIEYFTAGKDEGINQKLGTRFEQEIQQAVNRITHKSVLGFSDKMTRKLIINVTGIKDEKGAKEDLEGHSSDGVPDRLGWGIRIYNITLSAPQLKGKLAEIAEKESIEKRERVAEEFEGNTEIRRANNIVEASKGHKGNPLSFEEALRIVKDYKAFSEGHGQIFRIPGLDTSLTEVISKILGGKK